MNLTSAHAKRGRRLAGFPRAALLAVALAAVTGMTLSSCGAATGGPTPGGGGSASGSSSSGTGSGSGSGASPTQHATVTLITDDSFAVDPAVLDRFEKDSGITVKILTEGDVGEMVSKLIVTKGNPLGDVVYGIDNTFAGKALAAGILAPYTSSLVPKGANTYAIDPEHRLTATDYGDVCVNVDHPYFTAHHLAEPTTFEDLAKPEYKNLFVAEDPSTSSPGLAFLLGTIAHFGTGGWQAYWKSLKANGIKIDSGWTEAYTVDFSGSTGKGDRPLVVSYASSPPSEAKAGDTTSPTGALLNTCFRQIEYAGVLAGTKNPGAAGTVIDFLLSADFQAQIPAQMYMYPVDKSVPLPSDWAKFAPIAPHPETLSTADIDANRSQWISAWTDLMQG